MNKKLIASALAVASTLLLAGCNQITVNNANGVGTCNGSPFTLTTSQDSAGHILNVDYTGPEDVSLVFTQGYYSDRGVNYNGSTSLVTIGSGDNDDVAAIVLDSGEPGWTTSGSGANTHMQFSGTIQTLIDNVPTYMDEATGTPVSAATLNSFFPATIGVDCSTSITTDIYGPDQTHPVSDLVFEAASMVYPNHQAISPLEPISSTPVTNGADVKFKYSDAALTAFGSFTPNAPASVNFVHDDPNIPNTTIRDLYDQFLNDGETPNAGTPVANGDGTFNITFTGYNNTPLATGDYILISYVPNSDGTEFRIVFTTIHYDETNGFEASDPFTNEPLGPQYDKNTLANTGNNSWVLAQIAFGALLLGGFLILATRKSA